MSLITTGTLIWVSVQPLIRLSICVGCGFVATKAGLFPAVAAHAIGKILLNITIPSLMFSKIVPAFNPSNIGELGPLVLVALIYMLFGLAIAWVIKLSFWVPHRFRYGILMAGGWSNIGDIPISVTMSIMSSAPFGGSEDANLAVSYIAAFLLVFLITLFPLGGHQLVMLDYHGPDLENEEVKQILAAKHAKALSNITAVFMHLKWIPFLPHATVKETDAEDRQPVGEKQSLDITLSSESPVTIHDQPLTLEDARRVSLVDEHMPTVELASSPSPGIILPVPLSADSVGKASETSIVVPVSRFQKVANLISQFFRSLASPPSLSIIVSFVISIAPPLKALFVPGVPGTHIPPAPDGQPPLAFIMNTSIFISGASVPMGLIMLGSALARLHVPRHHLKSLPLGAICSLAIGKVIVMPILGVLICQGLTRIGLIDPSNNVLRFVCIFVSCLPSATTQVFLTQVYSGTGNAEHLAVFLIPQYIIMLMSMIVVNTVTLHLLFG